MSWKEIPELKRVQVASGRFMLDLRGYEGSLLQLYTRKSAESLKAGEVLEVLFDDPYSLETVLPAFNNLKYKIVESSAKGGEFMIKIRRLK